MSDPQTPRNPEPDSSPAQPRGKRRKKGYRGYPNNTGAGDVHFGSGFAGVGAANTGGALVPIISERTREDAEEDDG